jgi:hypothetical protein
MWLKAALFFSSLFFYESEHRTFLSNTGESSAGAAGEKKSANRSSIWLYLGFVTGTNILLGG